MYMNIAVQDESLGIIFVSGDGPRPRAKKRRKEGEIRGRD